MFSEQFDCSGDEPFARQTLVLEAQWLDFGGLGLRFSAIGSRHAFAHPGARSPMLESESVERG
jgi:hypothetical protein